MSWIDHFTQFLFDENRRLSAKATVVVFIILGVLFVDNYLGFSYHYNVDKKIEQVHKINSLLSDSTVDSTSKAFAVNVRKEIINRKNIVDYYFSFFRGKPNNFIKPQTIKKTEITKNKEPRIPSIKNNFWFNISASGLYYLLAVILFPIIIFTDKTTSLSQRFASAIVASLLFFGIGWFFYWICGLIPQIANYTWTWNYLLNIVIQITLVGILIYVSTKKK